MQFSEDKANLPGAPVTALVALFSPPPLAAPTWEPTAWSSPVTLEAPEKDPAELRTNPGSLMECS